jgi:beta-lactam-binding protein with PASTA domain
VAVLVLLVLALAVLAAVVLTAPAPTKVVLRNVVYSDVQDASSALKQLVSENTQ